MSRASFNKYIAEIDDVLARARTDGWSIPRLLQATVSDNDWALAAPDKWAAIRMWPRQEREAEERRILAAAEANGPAPEDRGSEQT